MEGKYPPSGGWEKLIPSSREELERQTKEWKEYKRSKRKQEEMDKFNAANLKVALIALGVGGLLIFAAALYLSKF